MDQPPAGPPATPGGGGPDWGEMKGKLAAAKGPERLILIGGVLFFIDSFLPWYGVDLGPLGSFNRNGWNFGALSLIGVLLGIAATALVATSTLGDRSQLPVQTTGQLLLALCGGAFVFVLLRLLTQTSLTKFGIYLALIFTAIMTYGAWQRYKAAQ